MSQVLRVLLIEDSEDDALLIRRKLEACNYDLTLRRVQTADETADALHNGTWDLIISDYSLPGFDAPAALRLAQASELDVPFIIISGTIGEDTAVEAMRAGAADYLLKGNLTRLGATVDRELREADNRRAQRIAEEAQAVEQRRAAIAMEGSGAGVFEHRYPPAPRMYHSARWAEILGYRVEELPIDHELLNWFHEQIHPDDRAHYDRLRASLIGHEIDRMDVELRVRHVLQHWVNVSISCRLLAGPTSEHGEHVIGVMLDVTDRKKLEDRLLQSQKMEAVGRLAGGIAHDFNNALTAIVGFTRFAMESLGEGDPAHADLVEALDAAKHAENLTRQLLAFSRQQPADLKPVNINGLVGKMDRMLRRLLGEDIEVVTHLGNDLWNVRADAGQLEQVVVNLAVNARDAMPSGGKLTIETTNATVDSAYAAAQGLDLPSREYVVLAVSDNGHGIALENQARIFEPFFSTKGVGKGTGLGLSTCYGIVKQVGGQITVYSEPLQGTSFKVYLPRFEGDLLPERERAESDTNGGSETILVSEDDDQVRPLIARSLRRLGYEVIDTQSGADALRVVQTSPEPIHLLVTDVVMPEMNGRELADYVTKLRPEIRVLYISGYTPNAIVHHGVLDEGVVLLQKPFTPARLAEKVREVLDAPNRVLVSSARQRILCVDDDARALKGFERQLGSHYDVILASSGQAALQLLNRYDFDLVLCDIVMPGMDGGQVYERAVQSHPEIAERFVFVTGRVDSRFVRSFLAASDHTVLEKPLDPQALLAVAAARRPTSTTD